jgi:hypothetical protein
VSLALKARGREPDQAGLGADELLYPDGRRRGGPYAVVRTRVVERCGIVLLGSLDGSAAGIARMAPRRRGMGDGAADARDGVRAAVFDPVCRVPAATLSTLLDRETSAIDVEL